MSEYMSEIKANKEEKTIEFKFLQKDIKKWGKSLDK